MDGCLYYLCRHEGQYCVWSPHALIIAWHLRLMDWIWCLSDCCRMSCHSSTTAWPRSGTVCNGCSCYTVDISTCPRHVQLVLLNEVVGTTRSLLSINSGDHQLLKGWFWTRLVSEYCSVSLGVPVLWWGCSHNLTTCLHAPIVLRLQTPMTFCFPACPQLKTSGFAMCKAAFKKLPWEQDEWQKQDRLLVNTFNVIFVIRNFQKLPVQSIISHHWDLNDQWTEARYDKIYGLPKLLEIRMSNYKIWF